MTARDYQDWLSGVKDKEPPAVAGQKLFEQLRCGSCHFGTATMRPRGPALNNLFRKPVELTNGQTVIADDAYLRESILQPRAKVVKPFEPIMPPYEQQISEEGVLDLIAYIKSMNEEGRIAPAAGGSESATKAPVTKDQGPQ
jgi:cytochrome c oxidase subunit 2